MLNHGEALRGLARRCAGRPGGRGSISGGAPGLTDGRGRGGRGGQGNNYPPRAPPVPVPIEEFDFVKSNQQFDKDAIVKVPLFFLLRPFFGLAGLKWAGGEEGEVGKERGRDVWLVGHARSLVGSTFLVL